MNGHYTATGFRKMDLRDDQLRGAYGLAWYERKPRSLTLAEWQQLDRAVEAGAVSSAEYFDWKQNVQ